MHQAFIATPVTLLPGEDEASVGRLANEVALGP
jgi:hypothetical protein